MYTILTTSLPESEGELLQAILLESESAGVELRDGSLKPLPGTPPLPEGTLEAKAWYEDSAVANETLERILEEIPGATGHCEPAPEVDWNEAWKQHVRSTRAGRIWVGPSWLKNEAGDAPITLVIDPGMAFGTGDHPTTALCLEALDRALAAHPNASVLDVGTGSGVLAIAARKLGAGRIVGNDIDRDAVRIAQENAALNGAENLELSALPVERMRDRFDLVVANLFANVLCQLAPRLVDRAEAGGQLFLSGILTEQADEVLEAFARENVSLVERYDRGEWVMLHLKRS